MKLQLLIALSFSFFTSCGILTFINTSAYYDATVYEYRGECYCSPFPGKPRSFSTRHQLDPSCKIENRDVEAFLHWAKVEGKIYSGVTAGVFKLENSVERWYSDTTWMICMSRDIPPECLDSTMVETMFERKIKGLTQFSDEEPFIDYTTPRRFLMKEVVCPQKLTGNLPELICIRLKELGFIEECGYSKYSHELKNKVQEFQMQVGLDPRFIDEETLEILGINPAEYLN